MINLIEELSPLINEYNNKEEIKITLFELETIMALLYFYRNNVDFAVCEAISMSLAYTTPVDYDNRGEEESYLS